MEGSAPNKKVPAALIAGIIAAALAVAAVGGYFGLCSWVQGNGRLLPGAAAVDDQGAPVAGLGKLTQEEALAEAAQREQARRHTLFRMAAVMAGVVLVLCVSLFLLVRRKHP